MKKMKHVVVVTSPSRVVHASGGPVLLAARTPLDAARLHFQAGRFRHRARSESVLLDEDGQSAVVRYRTGWGPLSFDVVLNLYLAHIGSAVAVEFVSQKPFPLTGAWTYAPVSGGCTASVVQTIDARAVPRIVPLRRLLHAAIEKAFEDHL